MIPDLDTSALAKMCLFDPGAGEISAAVSSTQVAATRRLVSVEMHATLGQAMRTNGMAASCLELRRRDFATRWASPELVDLPESMARRGARTQRASRPGAQSARILCESCCGEGPRPPSEEAPSAQWHHAAWAPANLEDAAGLFPGILRPVNTDLRRAGIARARRRPPRWQQHLPVV